MKFEIGAFVNLWRHRNVSSIFLADIFGNIEPETDTVGVHLMLVLQESEQLEKLFLVLLWDTNSGIYDLYNQNLLVIRNLFSLHSYFDLPVFRELESVWLQT